MEPANYSAARIEVKLSDLADMLGLPSDGATRGILAIGTDPITQTALIYYAATTDESDKIVAEWIEKMREKYPESSEQL